MEDSKRSRSPNYPVVSLKSALEYLEKLHTYANGQHAVPMLPAINEAWGMKQGSAYGKQVVGALKSFGLIEDQGSGTGRKIRVSDTGAKIRGGHSTRDELIRKAALSPSVHQELWQEFAKDGQLPPAASLRQYLLFDRDGNRFNEAAVGPFIDEFVETVSFAKLSQTSGGQVSDTPKNGNDPDDGQKPVLVGSYVQWTSNGMHQFLVPPKVVGIEGDWAFVDGSQTGIPMSELAVVDPPAGTPPKPPANPFFKPKGDEPQEGMAMDRATLDEGTVLLEYPDDLSEESVEELQEWLVGRINRVRRKAGLEKIKIAE